jgi:hypothetical protein
MVTRFAASTTHGQLSAAQGSPHYYPLYVTVLPQSSLGNSEDQATPTRFHRVDIASPTPVVLDSNSENAAENRDLFFFKRGKGTPTDWTKSAPGLPATATTPPSTVDSVAADETDTVGGGDGPIVGPIIGPSGGPIGPSTMGDDAGGHMGPCGSASGACGCQSGPSVALAAAACNTIQ